MTNVTFSYFSSLEVIWIRQVLVTLRQAPRPATLCRVLVPSPRWNRPIAPTLMVRQPHRRWSPIRRHIVSRGSQGSTLITTQPELLTPPCLRSCRNRPTTSKLPQPLCLIWCPIWMSLAAPQRASMSTITTMRLVGF